MPHDRPTSTAATTAPESETAPHAQRSRAIPNEAGPEWLRGPLTHRDSELTVLTGRLTGIDDEGRPLFLAEGAETAVPVAIGIASPDAAIVRAARRQQRALVVQTSDPAQRWILVGLVRDRVSAASRDAKRGRLELTVDGEKVKLEAEHDIELRCGQASITLRYDGRIEVRGTHILSASRGPNRVKGATIALN